jgi:hypothetical protein
MAKNLIIRKGRTRLPVYSEEPAATKGWVLWDLMVDNAVCSRFVSAELGCRIF